MITRNDLEIYYGTNENLIYHYTNFSSALSILCSHFLIMSPLSNMNDPLEFNNYINTITYDNSLSNERASIILSELGEAEKNRQNHVRILSFSESFSITNKRSQFVYDNYLHQGWARSRMWAQYANNHEGVCLIFNKDKCINAAKKMNDCFIRAEPIKYTNNILVSNLLQNKVALFKIYWQYGTPRLSDIAVDK